MPTFERRTLLSHPASAVWDWHTRPGAFERLVPPWAGIENVRPAPLVDGAEQELRVHKGVWWRWIARIHDVVPGEQFVDTQERGPFAAWVHTHRMTDAPGGSTLHDRLEYRLPVWPFGPLVMGRSVAADLARTFAYRHAQTAHDLDRHAAHPERPVVAVTGASGLVGTALCAFLESGGYSVRRLVRRQARHPGEVAWDPSAGTVDVAGLAGVGAIVHLAGASIAQRWSASARDAILSSRVDGTAALARALASLPDPPAWISGSAVGFYGDTGATEVDETAPTGDGFLAEVVRAWEAATQPAIDAGVRVVHLRTGIVLAPRDAFLAAVLPLFRLGLGGPVGSGEQYVPWITLDDLVGLIQHLIHADVRGPVNATAPEPVRQRDLAKTLGRVLRRPAFLPAPSLAIRTLLGQMGTETALWGQRAVPTAALASRFQHRHPTLEPALRAVLGR